MQNTQILVEILLFQKPETDVDTRIHTHTRARPFDCSQGDV